MWALQNRTPYAADRNWVRDKEGVHHWLVAVKATFDVGPAGKLTLSDEQAPPLLAPEFRGDPDKTSLRMDSDLLAIKPGTDVLVDASAHAPKGRAAPTVPVSLRVGDLEKTLLVHGTRVYYRGAVGMTLTAPKPFLKHPIHYEWAFGGMDMVNPDPRKQGIDARNPVGKGFAVDARRLENQPAHAIEYPHGKPEKVGPAGFGPISSAWSPRLELAGTYDEPWEKSKKPLLPDDYDERFALGAPADQRPSRALRGGETFTVLNLTPDGALSFSLPEIRLALRTRFGGRSEEQAAALATVFLDAEAMKLSVVVAERAAGRGSAGRAAGRDHHRGAEVSVDVNIVAVGARTAVGLRAESSAAAVRAAISRLGEHPLFVDAAGDPLRCAFDSQIAPTALGRSRMLALTISVLGETLEKMRGPTEPPAAVPLLLALPDLRPGFDKREGEAFVRQLQEASFPGFGRLEVEPVTGGHAAFFVALESATRRIAQRQQEWCLVGGIDSYFETATLTWLEGNKPAGARRRPQRVHPPERGPACWR